MTSSEATIGGIDSVRREATGQPLVVLDFLRGIAALGVACYHVRVTLWVGWREIAAHPDHYSVADRAIAWLSAPFPFMGSLVMLFFVISGFCIHWPLAATSRPLPGGAYACRRLLRIYPPYLAAVAVSILASFALDRGDTSRTAVASALMVQNYLAPGSAGDEAAQLSTNWSLWSLPVEMELYAVYPLLLIGLRRWTASRVLAMSAMISVAATVLSANGVGWLQLNFSRYLVIWFAGAWLADQWRRGALQQPPRWTGAVAICGLAVACLMETSHRGAAWTHLCYGGFYFWLVWLLLAHPPWWSGLPSRLAAVLSWLGTRSYSLYLLHFPLFYLFGAWWMKRFGGQPHNFAVPMFAVVLILPVVTVFYRWIEQPSHGLAKRAAAAFAPRRS